MTLIKRRYKITSRRHPHWNEQGDFRGQRVGVTGQMILHMVDCHHGTQRCAVTSDEVEEVFDDDIR